MNKTFHFFYYVVCIVQLFDDVKALQGVDSGIIKHGIVNE